MQATADIDGTSWGAEKILADISQGTDGNDDLVGFNTDDQLSCGLDNDRLSGGGGNDFFNGEAERDVLSFRASNDSVYLNIAA